MKEDSDTLYFREQRWCTQGPERGNSRQRWRFQQQR